MAQRNIHKISRSRTPTPSFVSVLPSKKLNMVRSARSSLRHGAPLVVAHYCPDQILFRIFTRSNASITITFFTSHPHLSIFVLWKFSRHEKYVNIEGVVGWFDKKVFLLFCTFPFPLIAPHMHSATSVFAVFLYPYHHHVILSICDNITAAKV